MILLAVPVLAGALLLVVAGLEHIRDPAELARAAGTGTVLARMIAIVELLIGVPSVAAVFTTCCCGAGGVTNRTADATGWAPGSAPEGSRGPGAWPR